MNLTYNVTENIENLTVKDVLLSKLKISHRLLTKLKKLNCILVNNKPLSVNHLLNVGDFVEVSFDYEEDNENIVPTKMELSIIYEDDAYIVINKPSGIPVHPSILHYEDSLSNGIRYYFDSIGLKKKIRPVNRIDKDTSRISCFC